MKAFRAGLVPLAALALSFVFQHQARADVRTIRPVQTLTKPTNPSYRYFGLGLAIDGPHLIVLAINDGATPDADNTYAALLYRRNLSDGRWVFRRTLVTARGSFARMDVRMRNNLAAVNFGGQVSLFEYSNGDYRPAATAAPIRHPGSIAISNSRVLIGGDNCDYDAVVYSKGTNGIWDISARLDDNAGECDIDGLQVTLDYDYAIVRPKYGGGITAWRRNGTALNWIPAGALALPPDTGSSGKGDTLQGATAVTNSGHVFRRSGTSTWTLQGKATSVDMDNSWGVTFDAVYRDGVLVTSESGYGAAFPRIYLESSPGRFEHVASLTTYENASEIDVSRGTVAIVARDPYATRWDVHIYTLPTQLRAPAQIVNDFEDRDTSDFTFNSGQFALATRGTDDVLAQNSSSTLAIALTDTDWTDYQRIEAHITPTFSAGDSWAGLVARYVDPDNYYFVAIRANQTFGVYKRVNGVNTLLYEATYSQTSPGLMTLIVDRNDITFMIDNLYIPIAVDSSLPRGRAGLATWQARADFDDVRVAGTSEYGLFWRDWGPWGNDYQVDMTTVGGNWQVAEDPDGYKLGLSQSDTSGDAVAYVGTPVTNQEILANVRLNSFRASSQGAWFGLLARRVDAQNQYYVTVRSSGQIQIRKIVNGVISVLASANFTAVPEQTYELKFRVINDQLQVFVNRMLVASAHDASIASGQYGLATYRAAATWDYVSVVQP